MTTKPGCHAPIPGGKNGLNLIYSLHRVVGFDPALNPDRILENILIAKSTQMPCQLTAGRTLHIAAVGDDLLLLVRKQAPCLLRTAVRMQGLGTGNPCLLHRTG